MRTKITFCAIGFVAFVLAMPVIANFFVYVCRHGY